MNNLEKIQKTMKVFQTLTKIVMGFSFVAIAFTLVVGSVSLMADKLPFGELLQRLLIEADRTIDNREIGIALLCESVVLVFGAIEMDDADLRVLGFHAEKLVVLLDGVCGYDVHGLMSFGLQI